MVSDNRDGEPQGVVNQVEPETEISIVLCLLLSHGNDLHKDFSCTWAAGGEALHLPHWSKGLGTRTTPWAAAQHEQPHTMRCEEWLKPGPPRTYCSS